MSPITRSVSQCTNKAAEAGNSVITEYPADHQYGLELDSHTIILQSLRAVQRPNIEGNAVLVDPGPLPSPFSAILDLFRIRLNALPPNPLLDTQEGLRHVLKSIMRSAFLWREDDIVRCCRAVSSLASHKSLGRRCETPFGGARTHSGRETLEFRLARGRLCLAMRERGRDRSTSKVGNRELRWTLLP